MSAHSTRLKHTNYLAEYHTQINLAGEDNQTLDNPLLSGPSHISYVPEGDDDEEMMISKLWTPIVRDELVIHEEEEEGDSLESLLQALLSQDLISCELPRFAAGTSSELPDDGQEDDNEEGTDDNEKGTDEEFSLPSRSSNIPDVKNPTYLLPRKMIEREFCTRFVTSSPHASPMELVKALKDSIRKAAEQGVTAYDCKNLEECLLIPHAHFWGSDNPMQAEECSHGGLQCNFFCRTCEVGGTQEVKRSEPGYLSLFKVKISQCDFT
ncbi:hypothetical protein PQX77_021958 [Marasmius sp. AFHP31]|nr:hypothetical protein PQX77_021958 [Marasmius sp. AFHP31]